jgi:hypothetical protein
MAIKKKGKVTKKKVCETFEITDGKKEETKDFCGEEIVKENASPKEKSNQNKILFGVLAICATIIVLILVFVFVTNSMKEFDVNGVSYTIVQEGNLVLYQTKFPMIYQGKSAIYNIYFRTDPRKLEKNVAFDGNIDLKQNVVINTKADIYCDADGVIALANLAKLNDIFGVSIIKDENASCDSEDRYTYVEIISGNETKINQVGNTCYELVVNNCEILPATEKFMSEVFAQYWADKKAETSN